MPKPENTTARIGRWSVQNRKKAILGWLAFVVVSVVIGFNVVPQKQIEPSASGPRESGQAAKVLDGAFEDKASEQVLVQSDQLKAGDPRFKAAVADVHGAPAAYRRAWTTSSARTTGGRDRSQPTAAPCS